MGWFPILLMTSTGGVVPRVRAIWVTEGRAHMGMTGAYERNLDAKGRLSLPAPLREELGEHVRVFKALDVDALYVFSAEAFDKWVEGLFAGREGHEGFNPRDINDQKLMRAINKRTTSMDVDSAGRIGLSESLRKQANLDREVTVVGNYDHLEVWDRAAADEDDDDEALLDLFFS